MIKMNTVTVSFTASECKTILLNDWNASVTNFSLSQQKWDDRNVSAEKNNHSAEVNALASLHSFIFFLEY